MGICEGSSRGKLLLQASEATAMDDGKYRLPSRPSSKPESAELQTGGSAQKHRSFTECSDCHFADKLEILEVPLMG